MIGIPRFRRMILFLSIAWLLICPAFAEPIPASEDLPAPRAGGQSSDAAQAIALFKEGNYDESLKRWEKIVQADPDLPPARVILAQLFSQAQMFDQAHAALEAALNESPDDPEAYLFLAIAAVGKRDLAKADTLLAKAGPLVAAFQKSEKRKIALQALLHSSRASLAEARGDWAESQKQVEAWLALNPNNSRALHALARCLLKQNQEEAALKTLRDAAKLEPDAPPPEIKLAQMHQQFGDLKRAEKWITAALAAHPKNLAVRLFASQFALETGKLDEARRQSIAAIRLDGESLEAKLLQGEIANYEMNFEGAELFFEAVLKRMPDNLAASNNLALSLISQEDEAKRRRALELAEANAKKYPQMAQVASTLGIVLYRLGRLDDAEKALAGAASIKETDPETAYVFARLAADRGQKAEALHLLKISLRGVRPFMYRQEAEELLEKWEKQ